MALAEADSPGACRAASPCPRPQPRPQASPAWTGPPGPSPLPSGGRGPPRPLSPTPALSTQPRQGPPALTPPRLLCLRSVPGFSAWRPSSSTVPALLPLPSPTHLAPALFLALGGPSEGGLAPALCLSEDVETAHDQRILASGLGCASQLNAPLGLSFPMRLTAVWPLRAAGSGQGVHLCGAAGHCEDSPLPATPNALPAFVS